jgi:M6 family metalloprotease-like protein
MKKILLSFIILILLNMGSVLNVQASYLKNIPRTLIQPNGDTLNCFISGDEFYNYLHDINNYTIVQNQETGFFVYATRINNQIVPSLLIPGVDNPSTNGLIPGIIITPEEWRSKRNEFRAQQPLNNQISTTNQNQGHLNNIVVFIRFSNDTSFTTGFSTVNNMFNDSSANANSMYNYFKSTSYNKLFLSSSFYPSPSGNTILSYQDIYPRSYYLPYSSTNPNGYNNTTEGPAREQALLQRAINYIASSVPGSLNLDYNNDGDVDNLCFVVKGEVSDWNTLLWPHRWVLYYQDIYINSKRVYDYNFILEGNSDYFKTSVICHEMQHTLGFPDLYHYNFTTYDAVGTWDLMSQETNIPQNSVAYAKYKYGHWIDSIPLITNAGTYTLNPLATSSTGNAYKIASIFPGQYFILEYRSTGSQFDSNLPGSGLIIYRVNDFYDGNASCDGITVFDEIYIFRPNGTNTTNGSLSTAFFNSTVGRTMFNPSTNPRPFFTNGDYSSLNITNITNAGNTISFTYNGTQPTIIPSQNQLTLSGHLPSGASVQSVLIFGINVTDSISINSSSPFLISNNNSTWGTSIKLPPTGGTLYVKYNSIVLGSNNSIITLYNGSIQLATINLTGIITDISSQSPIASWSFPTQIQMPNTPTSFTAETGNGTIYLEGSYGSSVWAQATQLNMYSGVTTSALTLVDSAANGKSMVFALSMSNLQNLTLSFQSRGTTSGFATHEWSYSTDGTNFTTYSTSNTGTTLTTFSLKTVDFSFVTALNNQPNVYIKVTLSGATSGTGNNRFDDIVFQASPYSTGNTVATPIISVPTSVIYTPTNVSISCSTAGASIYYTTDGTVPTQTSTLYSTPIPVTANMTLKAKAFLTGYTESFVATSTYTFPIEVANIAAFKAANTTTSGTVYKITGDVTFVYRNGRNIFVKDATAGLCIYDNTTPVITQTYTNGDVISGGIFGSCTMYGGLHEFIPTFATAAGTPGTPVTPLVITADALTTNFSQYESQLVQIEGVTFATGTFGTGAAGNVNMTQGTTTLVCRNQFGALTGYTTDATQPYDVVGFAIPYNTAKQVAPRALTDITPSYTIPTYTVTFPTLTGVTFTPEIGSVSPVDSLGNFSFTVALDPAYSNSVIIVKTNGNTITPVAGVYTISTITSDQVITIEGVAINTYTIIATAGANGTITPSGTTTVNHGSNQSFTITPDNNYQISTITIDGVVVTNVPVFTFTNVTANHTIAVAFELIPVNQFQITATAGANGSITPNGIVNVISGNDQAFTIAPSLGYHIDSVLVDEIYDATATTTGAYTFTNVTANHTIRAVFAVNTFTITATAGANGSVSPSGVTTYNYSANAAITATPDNGYQIDSMFVDGVFTNPIATYLFQNITANHTIHYTFSLIPLPSFIEDFETLSAGTGSYAGSNLTFATGIYFVKGYTTMDANDRFLGTRSIRMRGNASDPNGNEITMTFDRPNGIGTVSFKYGSYGTHSGGAFVVQYSLDQGASWNDVPSNSFTAPLWNASTGMETGNVVFNVPGAARIRFFKAMQGSGTSVNIDNIEMTDYTAVNTVATPTFNHPSGTVYAPFTVEIATTTTGASIYYTTDGSVPSESSTLYTTPINITATTTLKAKAFKAGMTSSFVASAVYTFPVQVNTIEEFIDAAAGVTSTTPYRISGDVTFVFRSGRYIYIKDNTACLIVLDNATTPVITNTYQNGDVISGGITGTFYSYFGLSQFIPIMDWAASTSNTGAITPLVVTAQEIADNYGLYESKLVTIQDVTFSAGEFNTTTTTNVNFTQGTNQMAARNVHKTLSMTIAEGFQADITGFVLRYNTTFQIAPRDNNDIVENVPEQVTTPTFAPAAGTHGAPLTVTITCTTPDALIYYTTDGATPTDQSQLYTAPVILEAGQYTMKAIAYKAGMTPSEVASVDYLVTLGVDDYLAQMIQIYPNPATQFVNINTTSDAIQITGYQIFDQFGKVMIQSNETLENNQINITNFASGMYVIRLLTNEGAINKKLMKL